MPPSHPREEWKVTKRDHPASAPEEVENEPDWARTGHEHYPGYRNRQGRRPGHTDENEQDWKKADVKAAWDRYKRTKQRAEDGHLVNWQDAVKSQNVSIAFMWSLLMSC